MLPGVGSLMCIKSLVRYWRREMVSITYLHHYLYLYLHLLVFTIYEATFR